MQPMKIPLLLAIVGSLLVFSACSTTPSTTTTTTTTTSASTSASNAPPRGDETVRIINGKRYVYVRPELGSNIPGRWVLESSAAAQLARQTGTLNENSIRRTQDMQGQGLDPGGAKAVPGIFSHP